MQFQSEIDAGMHPATASDDWCTADNDLQTWTGENLGGDFNAALQAVFVENFALKSWMEEGSDSAGALMTNPFDITAITLADL